MIYERQVFFVYLQFTPQSRSDGCAEEHREEGCCWFRLWTCCRRKIETTTLQKNIVHVTTFFLLHGRSFVRVVKEVDLKSTGPWPRRFKSCSDRFFSIFESVMAYGMVGWGDFYRYIFCTMMTFVSNSNYSLR